MDGCIASEDNKQLGDRGLVIRRGWRTVEFQLSELSKCEGDRSELEYDRVRRFAERNSRA
jgi:hypothetical protein